MKTLFKVLAGVLLVVVLLFATAGIYLKFFFDPNDLRAQITKVVKDRTGRDLIIEGDFAVTAFPWLGVNVGRTRLSDDPFFANDTLLSFDRVNASVRLLPLFKKQLELGSTTVEGANLTLIRNADGVSNWQTFLDKLAEKDPAAPAAASQDSGFNAQSLGAMNIKNAVIRLDDKQLEQSVRFSELNLSTSNLLPGEPFDADLTTKIDGPKIDLQVELNGQMTLTQDAIDVNQPVLHVVGSHYSVPFGKFDVKVNGESLVVRESDGVMGVAMQSPDVAWSVEAGRDAAAIVKAMSGKFKSTSLIQASDIVRVEAPTVEFSGQLDNDPVNMVKGTFNSAQLTLKGTDATMLTAVMDFDATLNGKPIKTFKGKLNSPKLALTGDVVSMTTPVLDFNAMLDGDPVKDMQGKFSGTTLSRKGTDTQISAPDLTFTSTLNDDTIDQMQGQMRGSSLSVKNDSLLTLPSPTMKGTAGGKGIPEKRQDFDVTGASLVVNLESEQMTLKGYRAKTMGMDLTGDMDVSALFGDQVVNTAVTFAPLNARTLLKKLEIDLDTSDAKALTAVSGKADVRYTKTAISLKKLDVKMDNSRITGDVTLGEKDRTVVLNLDQIDLDRYLPAPEANAGGKAREVDAIEIPAQTIRELNLNGQFKVGRLTMTGIESQNIEANIAAKAGKVRVHPAKAQIYGGTYSGDIRVDASGEVPVMSLNEQFDNVDFGALIKDMADSDRLSGRITGNLVMTARGHNTSDLKATSSGTTSFSIKDGVLKGVNVMESVRNIVALANKEAMQPDEPDETKFRKLSGSAKITNGVLVNDDLAVEMPLMRVTGGGKLDLNTKAIDYKIGARVVQEGNVPLEKELQFLANYTLPLFISGTYEAPVIDKGRSVTDLIAQYAKSRIKDELLGGIFGRRKEPVADPKAPVKEPVFNDGTSVPVTTPTGDQKAPDPAAAEKPPLTPEEEKKRKEKELKDELDKKLKDKLKDLLGG